MKKSWVVELLEMSLVTWWRASLIIMGRALSYVLNMALLDGLSLCNAMELWELDIECDSN